MDFMNISPTAYLTAFTQVIFSNVWKLMIIAKNYHSEVPTRWDIWSMKWLNVTYGLSLQLKKIVT